MRECKTCHAEKPLSYFPGPNRRECRICDNAKRKAAYRAARGGVKRSRWDAIRFTPEEARARNLESQKRSKLKLNYGITLAEFQNMVAAQDGKCAICASDGQLCVDHCHKSGRVRSLMCDACNKGLGHFRDDPSLLRAAAVYLDLAGNSIVPLVAAQVLSSILES